MASSTAVHSNAFNFMSYLQGGVDPRTGQYTVAINLPALETNDLAGPAVPLVLSFNPLNLRNSGFGPGWSLQLTEFDLTTRIVSLSSGETFKTTGKDPDGRLRMLEQKLDNFHVYEEGTEYRVVHKSGLTEILAAYGAVALPTSLYSPEGRRVTLDYVPYKEGYQLASIKDERDETLLALERQGNTVSMKLYPHSDEGGGALAVFDLIYDAGVLETTLTLPTDEGARWLFKYKNVRDFYCITEVETPTGAHEFIEYGDAGHQHPAPGIPNLPRVTLHRADPGFGQPVIETRYSYDLPGEATHHNFLGFGAPGLIWNDDGLDNLYQVTSYDYSTIESLLVANEEVRRVERTFNAFHLVTEEKTHQKNTLQRVKTTYHANETGDFSSQPNNFQLPAIVETFWELDGASRAEVERTEYDLYGNLIEQVGVDGVTECSTYYAAEGEEGCPADPEGFVRHLKERVVIPATGLCEGAHPLKVLYRYSQFQALDAQRADWLALESETLVDAQASDGRTLQSTVYSYYDDISDPLLYGRSRRETVVWPAKDGVEMNVFIDYEYTTLVGRFSRAGETVLQTKTVESNDFDQTTKTVLTEASLIHGQPLLVRDDNDVEIRYTYDALARVLSETVAPETEYAATRIYEYWLSTGQGSQSTQTSTNVKGVKTRTLLDGFNRVVGEERQNADAQTSRLVEVYRPTYAAAYDVLGNLVKETEYDWLDDTQALELSHSFLFDDWGQQCTDIRPDGVKAHQVTDPIGTTAWKGRIVTEWNEIPDSSIKYGHSVSWLNAFDKPVRTERFDGAGDKTVSLQEYFYDGLGRTAQEVDGRNNTTSYEYDAFDRLIKNTLADGAEVVREYAFHSGEDWPTRISVDSTVLGEQCFDGLGRMTTSITGGRKKEFSFREGERQPCKVKTAQNNEIEYDYLPQLGEEPSARRLLKGGTHAAYRYDAQNARLLACSEQGHELTREYFSTGEIKNERVIHGEGEPFSMEYGYSLRGRLLAYKDVLGQTQRYDYDALGQLIKTELGSTASVFTYNGLGLIESITTEDSISGQHVTVTLEYDEHGRETLRTFDLDGVEQTLEQAYDEVDNLTHRTLSEAGKILRDERYSYDVRSRLEIYECSGTQPPVDPHGRSISMQIFIFDTLDNITSVDTFYADGGQHNGLYMFESNDDPTQLSSFTYTLDGGAPKTITLSYDGDGNMINDEQGRTLAYDELGRLMSVSASAT